MKDDRQDRAAFAAILKGLMINSSVKYSTLEEEKAVYKFYFEALKHLELKDIDSAAKTILLKWKYNRLPTVAEILFHTPQYALPVDLAEIQAGNVIEFLNRYGASKVPDFKDPITEHLMTRRWPYLDWAKNIYTSQLVWWRKEFKEAYIAMADYEVKYLPPPTISKAFIEHYKIRKEIDDAIG
jgi:hypothetical protein